MHKLVSFMILFGLAAVLLAHSAGVRARVASAAMKPVTVYVVQRAKFKPPTWGFDQTAITIPPGTTVTWKSVPGNSDSHTSTSNDDVWNSPLLNPGDTWSFTFLKTGNYRYHCSLHSWMVGVVNVVAGAPVPPAKPAPTPQ
ncbi:MAG TPA: plastocyanin/azurin family copper-binding protein [bacterium]|nr:plastocyanin/azurin family copper-binding protein [bacterium]